MLSINIQTDVAVQINGILLQIYSITFKISLILLFDFQNIDKLIGFRVFVFCELVNVLHIFNIFSIICNFLC